jgi:hypothetical protein
MAAEVELLHDERDDGRQRVVEQPFVVHAPVHLRLGDLLALARLTRAL